MTGRSRGALIASHAILIAASLVVVLTLLWVLRTSLAHKVVAYQLPPALFFMPTLDNYREIFERFQFHWFFFNSVSIALITTLVALVIGSLAAYSISRYRTGGTWGPVAILSTQMLPPITVVIPFFLIFKELSLANTHLGLVIAYLSFNLPYVVWLLMSFLAGVPRDLDEAGLVDGCTPATAFFKIVLPAMLPGIGAASLMSFVLCWNEFLFALMLSGDDTKTLPVAISSLITQQGTAIGAVSAATMLAIAPMVAVFFVIRRVMVKGLSIGAVKG